MHSFSCITQHYMHQFDANVASADVILVAGFAVLHNSALWYEEIWPVMGAKAGGSLNVQNVGVVSKGRETGVLNPDSLLRQIDRVIAAVEYQRATTQLAATVAAQPSSSSLSVASDRPNSSAQPSNN
jgi:hypothetical protein